MKNVFVLLLVFILSTAYQKASAQSEFSNPTISVGVVVADLQKSIDFYTNVIGMTKTGAFSVTGEQGKGLGLTDGRSIDVTILKLVDSESSNEWKLMSFGEKANHPKQKYMHDDNGIQYVSIFVNHLNPFIERIKKNNIKILSDVPSTLSEGRFFILIQDPDGTFIEIMGPK